MIQPTIGRVVLFYTGATAQDQALPALVCYVHSDRLINIGGFNANGEPMKATSVQLLQDDDAIPSGAPYACWMPYQVQAAAKARSSFR